MCLKGLTLNCKTNGDNFDYKAEQPIVKLVRIVGYGFYRDLRTGSGATVIKRRKQFCTRRTAQGTHRA